MIESIGIGNPKWECPVCGVVEGLNLNSTITGIEGDWCLKCYMQWVAKNVPKLKKLEEK